jgi:hypothetical protein
VAVLVKGEATFAIAEKGFAASSAVVARPPCTINFLLLFITKRLKIILKKKTKYNLS